MIRANILRSVLFLVLLSQGAAAQASHESSDATLRATCRLAAQALSTGHPSPQYNWAAEVIAGCDDSGGQALAAAWMSAPTDSVSLVRLVYSSCAMRDQRILTALTAVVAQPSQPQVVRLSGLSVLASYVDSTVLAWPEVLRSAPTRAFLPTQTDVSSYATTSPIAPGAVSQVLDVFRGLAATDVDPVIRNAARYLRDGFALRGS